MNKKGNTISIALLVFLVLAVVGISLFYFISEKINIEQRIYSSNFLSQMYDRQSILDSYLQDVFDRAAKGSILKEDFIKNATTILKNDKIPTDIFIMKKDRFIYFPEYSQILSQLKPENIEMIEENGKLIKMSIALELSLKDRLSEKDVPYALAQPKNPQTLFSVTYTYTKIFTGSV